MTKQAAVVVVVVGGVCVWGGDVHCAGNLKVMYNVHLQ